MIISKKEGIKLSERDQVFIERNKLDNIEFDLCDVYQVIDAVHKTSVMLSKFKDGNNELIVPVIGKVSYIG